ncbi:hypothetical protein, partial [Enorma phocaeensis]|uniref:hypothetical protein n=1 Tax=Enorma phocaeensis TaxID=1871019 RepID=UPI00195CD9AF
MGLAQARSALALLERLCTLRVQLRLRLLESLDAAQAEITDGMAQIADGQAELDANQASIDDGLA